MEAQLIEFKRHAELQTLCDQICDKLVQLEYDIAFETYHPAEAEQVTDARWARLDALECPGVGLLKTDNTDYRICTRALESVFEELAEIEEAVAGELVTH